jgi:oligosaccharyltransferase complex subunit beta
MKSILALALLAAVCLPAVHAQKRILALLGSAKTQDTHSQFFRSLKDNGFSVDIKTIKDDVKLREYDTWLYDSLILFAPKATSERVR